MGTRIQPTDITVPEENPFANDLLDRKQSIQVLTRLLSSVEGPCVLAVDAPWGTGKTTFLKIWIQYLRNKQLPAVYFNAWANDFTEDPFIAITSEITKGIDMHMPSQYKHLLKAIQKEAGNILFAIASDAVKAGTHGIVDPRSIKKRITKELSKEEAYGQERLARHHNARQYVEHFRASLQQAAITVMGSNNGSPLVVVIDELDRCRPSYAIQLLEVAKHLFSVDGIVFVLAINRSELAHSIRAVYGNEFDAEGYLHRFFDLDFRLPSPDRNKFIHAMIDELDLPGYFNRTTDQSDWPEYQRVYAEQDLVASLLNKFLSMPDLSFRKIAQAIHRLRFVFSSLGTDQRSFASMAVLALILRTIDTAMYFQFIQGETTDSEVVSKLLSLPYLYNPQSSRADLFFTAMVIVAAQKDTLQIPLSSPLLSQYQNLIESVTSSEEPADTRVEHAARVLRLVKDYDYPFVVAMRKAFDEAAKCLELISPNLVDERPIGDTVPE